MLTSKQIGVMFFALASLVVMVVVLTFLGAGEAGKAIVGAVVRSLKYLAMADLFVMLGVIFLWRAPQQDWDWQAIFSLKWWQEAWLAKGFKAILIFEIIFVILSVCIDFAYKLALASGALEGIF
jgi:hypothetical protein